MNNPDLLDMLIDQQLTCDQVHAKNLIMSKGKRVWVFNGEQCSVKEMADKIWSNNCPEKTMFLLKYE